MSRAERRQNLARMREITQVAARHGFGYVFDRRGRRDIPVTRDEAAVEGEIGPASRGRRLRSMLEELGPTWVKFGQFLSTRPDIVPPDIVEELRGLQDDVTPEPFDRARAVLEQELGLTVER